MTLELWQARNEAKHGQDAETRAATRQLRTEWQLHVLYERYGHFENIQERLYSTVEEHIQEHAEETIPRWLYTFQHAVKRSMAQAQQVV